MPTTLTGQIERVTFENDETGFRVLRVGTVEGATTTGPIVVVGTFQAVGPGTRVRVTGDFVKDPRRGEQFRADSLVAIEPATLVGLEKYLGSGLIPGIGPGFARRIVETFGMESLKVLDSEPERLGEVSGIGARRAREIKKAWSEQRAVANVMVLLQTHGASPSLAARIFKRYGDRSAAIVQRSPYRLALEVPGVGFKTADRIARSLGIAGDHPERAQAGVMHELGSLADIGHVAVPRESLVERSATMLEIDEAHVEAAVDALRASERVVVEDDRVYLWRLHTAELNLTDGVARLLRADAPKLPGLEAAITAFEKRRELTLAPAQRAAVEAAAARKVLVITGGPGVGKTTIVRAVLSVLEAAKLRTRLAAPTGRAAKRLAEATGRDASTLHRLLEFEPRSGQFQRHAESPLDADAVIVDEASMIDLPLGAALVSAMPTKARWVIVGDSDQLPSVGPGALLRDLIDSGSVPVVRLNEIFRQAGESRIVGNAHRILRGEMPESANAEEPNADFFVVNRKDPEEAAAVVVELATSRIPKRFGFDPVRDIQVLTPMHRGPAGTQVLNQQLQAALNPSGPSLESRGQTLRVGDKVMQTRNDYERDVFNGDLGVVSAVDASARSLQVLFDGREVTLEDADLESLTLAYATSIHKSQGSEYPAVVVPMLSTHFVMLSRNLLYTAVTRARRLCVLVSDPRALRLALSEVRREERSTGLMARLREI
ncbi:MAG: ATP-dependent RecD-like DNA helicase [Myxococcales bacterium]|nr:ATP-dependent RecD-like DNA helicase [Myxococcales bacterium]